MSRIGWASLAIILFAAVGVGATARLGGGGAALAAIHPWHGAGLLAIHSADGPADLSVVPVPMVARGDLRDSWGDGRDGGRRGHHGVDIPAAKGTQVIAAAPGTVEKRFISARGGLTVYQRSRDGHWLFCYAHLAGYAPGLHEGQRLGPGDLIGFVGDTGDAGAGNYHLHFGLSRVSSGQDWWRGEDVDPYPWLARRPAPR